MKNQKYTLVDSLKEVLKEFLVVVIGLGLCVVALIIGAILPKSIFDNLPFEVLIILAFVSVLAVLYVICAIVAMISKIKSKIKIKQKSKEN
ncbi:MAG: hypothetical protein IJF75_01740 [Clostridia bacterium]|nr:hypothetical protein [Clostridia bacterium]